MLDSKDYKEIYKSFGVGTIDRHDNLKIFLVYKNYQKFS